MTYSFTCISLNISFQYFPWIVILFFSSCICFLHFVLPLHFLPTVDCDLFSSHDIASALTNWGYTPATFPSHKCPNTTPWYKDNDPMAFPLKDQIWNASQRCAKKTSHISVKLLLKMELNWVRFWYFADFVQSLKSICATVSQTNSQARQNWQCPIAPVLIFSLPTAPHSPTSPHFPPQISPVSGWGIDCLQLDVVTRA